MIFLDSSVAPHSQVWFCFMLVRLKECSWLVQIQASLSSTTFFFRDVSISMSTSSYLPFEGLFRHSRDHGLKVSWFLWTIIFITAEESGNFFGRPFFIIAEEWGDFLRQPFFITAEERGDFFFFFFLGRPFLITSMLLLSFIFWLSHLIFLICVWLALVWESLSAYTCLRIFSHLATFRWLTSSYGASSFRLR